MKLYALIDGNEDTLFVEIGSLIFIWEGGQYIDVLVRDSTGDVSFTELNINVYDMESKPLIDFEMNSFIDHCMKWIDERS